MSDKKTQDEIEISDSKKSSDKESVNEGDNSSASNHKFKKGNGKGSSKGNRTRKNKENNFKDELSGPAIEQEGILEISGKGFGFLREKSKEFRQTPDDIFVTPEIVRNFGLRDGLWVKAETQMGRRGPQLTKLLDINGRNPDEFKTMPWFEELKAINPDRRLQMETTQDRMTTRLIDMIAPIGRGQRGLIVAPPRSGKTTILQHLAEAVIQNHRNVKVMVLLVEE
ncbi:MAG: hypothetical protein VYA85_02055 [Verrucomicrobiota bacterium]|nr:hypothetical protein [Verrucomicrobiota bacterium]